MSVKREPIPVCTASTSDRRGLVTAPCGRVLSDAQGGIYSCRKHGPQVNPRFV